MNRISEKSKNKVYTYTLYLGMWLIFQISPTLFAEEENIPDSIESSLISSQSLLSTSVDGVSVISGEWNVTETDFVVLGPEPLILSRGYSADEITSKKAWMQLGFSLSP